MGCISALRLAQAGLRPLVLERSVPGAEASSAAAGMLATTIEAYHPGYEEHAAIALGLGRWSRALHEDLATELRESQGIDIGHRRCGALRVAFDASEAEDVRAHHRALPADEEAQLLDGDDARNLEPHLSPEVVAALHSPREAQLEPRRYLRALAIAAERSGATFRSGAYVREVVLEKDRAVGVRLGNEVLRTEHIVVAAGSWSNLVPGLHLEAAKVHPVRGQVIACDARPPLFRSLVFGAGGYLCSRPHGLTLCGSTEERVGFRREVTLGGLQGILDIALRLAPGLRDAPLLDRWSNFRPGTADGLPLVGRAGPEGLWLASGHFRNGILLSPMTGEILKAALTGTALAPAHADLAGRLDPRRFLP